MKSTLLQDRVDNHLKEFLYYIREREVSYVSSSAADPVSLSLIDSIRESILKEAANVGLNNESLNVLDNYLQHKTEVFNDSISVLEKHVIDVLVGSNKCSISFNQAGEISNSINGQTLVSIDLREIINSTFPGLPVSTEKLKLFTIKEQEQRVVDILREPSYHAIKVIKRGTALDRAECEEKLPINKRVIDIMKEAAFQNIEIKQESGKPVYMNRIIKTKL
jgi:hypothetical protein